MPRFAFVTDEAPLPGRAGHLAVNHGIIAHLAAQGHAVDVILTRARLPAPVLDATALLASGRVQVLGAGVRQDGMVLRATLRGVLPIVARGLIDRMPARLARAIRRQRHGADAVLGAFPSEASVAQAVRQIRDRAPQAVLVDTIFRVPVLAALGAARPRAVLVAHDLFHRRHAGLSERGLLLSPARLTAGDEAELLRQADAIAAIQPEEAEAIQALVPAVRVFVCGHPVTPVPRPTGRPRPRDRLVFLGSSSAHNMDGLRWFLAACWPALVAARPALRLDVVGSAGPALRAVPQGVHVLGRVDDLRPALHGATLAIAPLLAGSGLKIKLLDAAAHGLLTVTTPVGAEGLAPAPDLPFVVADQAGFADGVLAALDRPDSDDLALRYCARHYGPDRTYAALRAELAA